MSIKQSVLKTFPPFPCASYNFWLFGVTLEYMKENIDSFESICSILLSKAIERGRQACTSSCLEKKKVSFYQCKKTFCVQNFFQSLEPKDVLSVCWPTIPSINFFKDLSTFFMSQEGDTCGLTLDYHFGLNIFFKWIFLTSRVTYFIW